MVNHTTLTLSKDVYKRLCQVRAIIKSKSFSETINRLIEDYLESHDIEIRGDDPEIFFYRRGDRYYACISGEYLDKLEEIAKSLDVSSEDVLHLAISVFGVRTFKEIIEHNKSYSPNIFVAYKHALKELGRIVSKYKDNNILKEKIRKLTGLDLNEIQKIDLN